MVYHHTIKIKDYIGIFLFAVFIRIQQAASIVSDTGCLFCKFKNTALSNITGQAAIPLPCKLSPKGLKRASFGKAFFRTFKNAEYSFL